MTNTIQSPVDAACYLGGIINASDYPKWFLDEVLKGNIKVETRAHSVALDYINIESVVKVKAADKTMTCRRGDYVLKTEDGNLLVCRQTDFRRQFGTC